ncbi:MAG: hypothetical protein U9O86_01880 [Campylobacterota bacterium]|nr:hypothetical protein [Campylobacterota bacterium]
MMSMSRVLTALIFVLISFFSSGCSTMNEGLSAQTEVPTLENQANRVAISMTIIRENNLMAFNMPISSDALWPAMMAADLNDSRKEQIDKLIVSDPYYATVAFTMPIQRKMLKTGLLMQQFGDYGFVASALLNQRVTPLTYEAMNKIVILYGSDTNMWPDIYNYENSMSDVLKFKNGTLKDIESPDGDIYDTIGEALISLTPIDFQKDLTSARDEMLYTFEDVASAKSIKGEYENRLKLDESNVKRLKEDVKFSYTPLSPHEKRELKDEITTIDKEIEQLKTTADEKETIYFELLDGSILALENDLNLDDKSKIDLAKNINIVSQEIQESSSQAYALFGLALSNILANNLILELPKEIESLAYAKIVIPYKLQRKYDKRLKRLVKNSLYIFPNIFVGTYYAYKQSVLAQKYEDITELIIEAYALKIEQETLSNANTQ